MTQIKLVTLTRPLAIPYRANPCPHRVEQSLALNRWQAEILGSRCYSVILGYIGVAITIRTE